MGPSVVDGLRPLDGQGGARGAVWRNAAWQGVWWRPEQDEPASRQVRMPVLRAWDLGQAPQGSALHLRWVRRGTWHTRRSTWPERLFPQSAPDDGERQGFRGHSQARFHVHSPVAGAYQSVRQSHWIADQADQGLGVLRRQFRRGREGQPGGGWHVLPNPRSCRTARHGRGRGRWRQPVRQHRQQQESCCNPEPNRPVWAAETIAVGDDRAGRHHARQFQPERDSERAADQGPVGECPPSPVSEHDQPVLSRLLPHHRGGYQREVWAAADSANDRDRDYPGNAGGHAKRLPAHVCRGCGDRFHHCAGR